MADIEVRNNGEKNQYEALVDGKVAGFTQYRLSDGLITFVHTEVDDAHEGEGIGSTLVRGALDDVQRQGDRKVVAECPFVKGYLERHDEYAAMLGGPLGAD